jgi:hypothetical protein
VNTAIPLKKPVQPGLKLITSTRDRVEEQIHLKIWLWLVSGVIATAITSQRELIQNLKFLLYCLTHDYISGMIISFGRREV